MNPFETDFTFANSHLPIRYRSTFTKPSDTWLMANNSANGKWHMANKAGGYRHV